MAQKTFTVSAVAGGGSSTQDITGMVNRALINRVQVVPSAAGDTYQVQFFQKDSFASTEKLYDSGQVTGTFVDPVENDAGTVTQHTTRPGMVFVARDADLTSEWHVKVINNDASARDFAFTVGWENTIIQPEATGTDLGTQLLPFQTLYIENIYSSKLFALTVGTPSTLTISGGSITRTAAMHQIDTEASASTDDLSTILGSLLNGQVLYLRAADSARTVVVKNGTGNIKLAGSDFSLTHQDDKILLIYWGSNWHEVSRLDATA